MPDASTRLRRLVDAGIALTSELSLDAVLQNLVETAAALTGARYAALGVINEARTGLERFLVTGLDAETHAAIGELPRGRGILGALIHDVRALRLDHLADDPRSVGFPPNHPPMDSFLGVPIRIRGTAWGNLYLTEKDGGPFTEDDEELVQLLAAQAAVAIENARLYEASTRWSRQLESLAEVGNALATEIDLARLLELIADRIRALVDARRVVIMLPKPDGSLTVEAAAGDTTTWTPGSSVSPRSKAARVLERRRSERVDSLIDDPEVDQEAARRIGGTAALFIPLVFRDRPIGVIACHDRSGADPRFTVDDLRVAETFAARAAVAADVSSRVQREALHRVVQAQELERQRLSRELHDETGQALTSIILGLKELEQDPSHDAFAALREQVVATLQSVRRLAVELRPNALDDFGLVPAVERLAETVRAEGRLQVELAAQLGAERLPPEVETALYRIVQEALTNVVKHSGAQRVSILLVRRPGSVSAVIEDDGRGLQRDGDGGDGIGLLGMRERLDLLDGRLQVESETGAGTTVVAEVPL